jgi:hypothetical protein
MSRKTAASLVGLTECAGRSIPNLDLPPYRKMALPDGALWMNDPNLKQRVASGQEVKVGPKRPTRTTQARIWGVDVSVACGELRSLDSSWPSRADASLAYLKCGGSGVFCRRISAKMTTPATTTRTAPRITNSVGIPSHPPR